MRRRGRQLVAVACVGLTLAACGSSSSSGRPGAARFTVDATVAPIADIVRQVVGDRARVVGLIPEGVDSHTFEPSPSTIRSLASADVLFMNGLHLEGSTLTQARANLRSGAPIVLLGDRTIRPDDYAFDFTFPKDKGDPNPHLWMDPVLARRYAETVRDTMAVLDRPNAPAYQRNQARFSAAIDRLDGAVRRAIDSIPAGNRKLVTYHDSFAYFSRRYGIPVIGAVQPSDFSEPTPRELQALIAQVKDEHVPAVFGSEVFPSTVLEEVARESGAAFVDKLRDDELPGVPGRPEHTYVGLMVSDVRIITAALGGDPSPLDAVPTARTWLP